ncbi:PIG-L deacetylase family protein [Streptomyces sp. NPDC015171]|uniref:PIG-L deacetylase family protein n=1 Tax=Streptomyces sp. NPDC015171 TaxID=3364945 RepID=UPI003701FC25
MAHEGPSAQFLGEPLDGGLFPADGARLAQECDGSRALASWSPKDQDLIARWYTAGLLVVAPAEAARTAAPGLPPIVVSPHPDDAQLALGGLVHRFGAHVVDVFSHETWTRRPYYQQRPELASRMLIEEERVACRVLDASLTLLGHVDGEARPAWSEGFFVQDDAAARVRAAEPGLLARITEDLAGPLAGDRLVLVPLAVGGHVDHVLAREAVRALVAAGDVAAERVAFYEDMPYSLFADPAPAAAELSLAWGEPLSGVPVPLDERAVEVKQESLWPYRLQVLEATTRRIVRYGRNLAQRTGDGGPGAASAERLWATAASHKAVRRLAEAPVGAAD